MRHTAHTIEPIDDDDYALFDVRDEGFVPDAFPIEREDNLDDGEWLRLLANDVTLLSRREWPKANAGWDRRDRIPWRWPHWWSTSSAVR
jgi:hypothetical protein